jgi:hypothetical protein
LAWCHTSPALVGLEHGRHALGLAQRGKRFVVAPGLRQHDGRQRVHHGQVPAVAGRVQRCRGFGNVLAHNRHVADLPIALAQVEMRQADGARIVRDLGLLQRAVVQRDGPGLFAAGKGDPPVQPPEIGMKDLGQVFANRVGRPSQHRSGLCKIPLQEVRFSQHDSDRELVIPGERRRRTQQGRQEFDGVGGLPALQRRAGPGDNGLKCGVSHGASI